MNHLARKPFCRTRIAALGGAVAVVGVSAWAPATAEDSGFWDIVRATRPTVRVFAPAAGFTVVPVVPGNPVRLPPVTKTPPDPSKRENPLAALLRDPTLRDGDIVMFPDGPRVFRGERGGSHSVHDFVAVAASREVSPATRKMLATMPVGENSAWSSNTAARTDRMARQAQDVETTGSIGKSITVRTGRGDVRVIQVP